MSANNPKVAQACRLLRKHAAPQALIDSFLELVEINDSFADQALRADINDLFVEACRKFNFTKPFEDDGRKRSFRAYHLPSEHSEYEHDSGSSVFFAKQERPGDLGREQAYRRAYDQGFSDAREMIKAGKPISEIENRQKAIHSWRVRRIQIVGSLPGSDENYHDTNVLHVKDIGSRLRYKILQRDNFRCQLCGNGQKHGARLEVDHKKSRYEGGDNSEENLWTLCFECNRGKHSQSIV
jgi:hypothetical protein